jgi:phospholipid/cholesterol/gamma-HCH transport system substrate-binding protein
MLKDLLRYRVNAVYLGAVLMTAFLIFLGVAYMINRSFTLTFWDPGYELKADFVDADGISNAADIRISGVYVGQVTEIRSITGGLAEITFRVDKEHSPLHEGTRANLRLQTLLGTKFIELAPGPANSAELAKNTVIPSNKTTSPVDFDQFLSSFNRPTREGISTLIKELGAATDGRGQDINALLTDLNQLSVQSVPNLQTFADRSDHINNILVSAADVTQNLSDNRQHLANVFTNFNIVLGTISANDPGFRKFIHEGDLGLVHGLNQFTGEQKNINDTFRLFRPALEKLNPTLEDATTFDKQLQPFINIAHPFTQNLLSAASGYNQNNAYICNPSVPFGQPGYGGPHPRPANGGCFPWAPNPATPNNLYSPDQPNPEYGVCNTEGQSVGCGGPYVRAPTVYVQDPSQVVDCENNAPAPSCPPGSATASLIQRSVLNFLLGQ